MNRTLRQFPELAPSITCFTMGTATRLSRALTTALVSRSGSSKPLARAVADAAHELRLAGLGGDKALKFLGTLVEDAGRACGADRPSLLSGELRWVRVRTLVLQLARTALGTPAAGEPVLAFK